MKGVMRFCRWVKLIPRYIRPFEMLWTIGDIAYQLALRFVFSAIHSVFHDFMLYMYVPNKSHLLRYDSIQFDNHLAFVEEHIFIFARDPPKIAIYWPWMDPRLMGWGLGSRHVLACNVEPLTSTYRGSSRSVNPPTVRGWWFRFGDLSTILGDGFLRSKGVEDFGRWPQNAILRVPFAVKFQEMLEFHVGTIKIALGGTFWRGAVIGGSSKG
ncbi:hypothetical protein MTR67_051771 [Solanum verrucosum]|uniref:Tf2-1-like SH3-like domain-containing protein n=1 Tax=Solanum verrucosum TaxID=315347 RepID=A0AAF0V7Y8_SOLVR|nr:hypothetical protein MTR67_051771 [Solanum verrucosum]